MPITLVGTSSAQDLGTATVTINVPAGTQNGDVMILMMSLDGGTATKPAAFTAVPVTGLNWNPGALGFKTLNCWYRVASSEPASYTITHTSGHDSSLVMATYRNVNNVTPIDTNNTTFVGASKASPDTDNITGITTTTANCMIVVGLMPDTSVAHVVTFTTSSGMTVEVTQSTSTNNAQSALGDVLQPAAGASGTKSWTTTAAGVTLTNFAYTVALRHA